MASIHPIEPDKTGAQLAIAQQEAPKVSNPAPLGLAGFGLTTVILSTINCNLMPAAAATVVAPLAFAYGGVAQILAGIFEYRNGNTFGTVAFTSYGLFWWWYAFMVWTIGAGWIKPPAPVGVGLTLVFWGVFTLYMWVSTFKANKGVWSVFLLLWITFFLLGAGDLGWAAGKVIGGWVGLITGLDALYVSFAEVTNGTFGRTVLPLGNPIVK